MPEVLGLNPWFFRSIELFNTELDEITRKFGMIFRILILLRDARGSQPRLQMLITTPVDGFWSKKHCSGVTIK